MPTHHDKDPVLLELNSGTTTALSNANIQCLKDLFGLTEEDILGISGIGPKWGREILNLLNALLFDYLDESLPGNPGQNPYLGVDPTLAEALSAQ